MATKPTFSLGYFSVAGVSAAILSRLRLIRWARIQGSTHDMARLHFAAFCFGASVALIEQSNLLGQLIEDSNDGVE